MLVGRAPLSMHRGDSLTTTACALHLPQRVTCTLRAALHSRTVGLPAHSSTRPRRAAVRGRHVGMRLRVIRRRRLDSRVGGRLVGRRRRTIDRGDRALARLGGLHRAAVDRRRRSAVRRRGSFRARAAWHERAEQRRAGQQLSTRQARAHHRSRGRRGLLGTTKRTRGTLHVTMTGRADVHATKIPQPQRRCPTTHRSAEPRMNSLRYTLALVRAGLVSRVHERSADRQSLLG